MNFKHEWCPICGESAEHNITDCYEKEITVMGDLDRVSKVESKEPLEGQKEVAIESLKMCSNCLDIDPDVHSVQKI